MSITTSPARRIGRADRPYNPGQCHRASFARQATIDSFGWRFARALDQADFVDRAPGQFPLASPEARFR